jgi:hypothetical protein
LADLTKDDSAVREYFNKHDSEEFIITGKYETEERYFTPRETLHSNSWEYGDDSDSCAVFDEQF